MLADGPSVHAVMRDALPSLHRRRGVGADEHGRRRMGRPAHRARREARRRHRRRARHGLAPAGRGRSSSLPLACRAGARRARRSRPVFEAFSRDVLWLGDRARRRLAPQARRQPLDPQQRREPRPDARVRRGARPRSAPLPRAHLAARRSTCSTRHWKARADARGRGFPVAFALKLARKDIGSSRSRPPRPAGIELRARPRSTRASAWPRGDRAAGYGERRQRRDVPRRPQARDPAG